MSEHPYAPLRREIEEFEELLAASDIEFKSACGRVTIHSDSQGNPLHLTLSPDIPRRVEAAEAERLLVDSLAAARREINEHRERFYSQLVINGETLQTWRKHPPAPGSKEAFLISAVESMRTCAQAKALLTKDNK